MRLNSSAKPSEPPKDEQASVDAPTATDSAPPGIYPVADLTRMSPVAVSRLLLRATQEAELEGASCPHLVTTWDVEENRIVYHGPFTTGLGALTFAHELLAQKGESDPERRSKLTVEPLLPH